MLRRDLLLLAAHALLFGVSAKAVSRQESGPDEISPQRVLILVELKGGNDGLNTLVPYTDDAYYQLRPRLAIPAGQVLPLNESVGMHPALHALLSAWGEGDLAWVQGLGYANPSLSHFRSGDIWETGSNADEFLSVGWLAQQLPTTNEGAWPDVVILGGDEGVAQGGTLRAVSMRTAGAFVNQAARLPEHHRPIRTTSALEHIMEVERSIQETATALQETLDRFDDDSLLNFPKTTLGNQLREAARIVLVGAPVPVFKVSLSGFDTHSNQPVRHKRLLTELAEALAAFRDAMVSANRWKSVLVMTYSEFGRRAGENNTLGTDHGTAAPHLVTGGAVKGGIYGEAPSLTQLDGVNLRYTTDYRRQYATVCQSWWGLTETRLGHRFPPLQWI